MTDLRILLLGDTVAKEFHEARRILDALGSVASFLEPRSATAAVASGQVTPDVIVIAQAYPGQFTQSAIEQLRNLAPLARVVALLGSWCEGETRSGKPAPAVVRLYWHQGPARCQQQLRRMVEGDASMWGLPVTATEEERLLTAVETPLPKREGLVAIHARLGEMESWLAAFCQRCGYSTVWLRPPGCARLHGAVAAIYDGSDCCDQELDELRSLAAALAPAPIVALFDFPRIGDHQRALAAGAAAVMAKPLLLDDLAWQLDQAILQAACQPVQARHATRESA